MAVALCSIGKEPFIWHSQNTNIDSAPDYPADRGAHPGDPGRIERCPGRSGSLYLGHPLQSGSAAWPAATRLEGCGQGVHPRSRSGYDLPVPGISLVLTGRSAGCRPQPAHSPLSVDRRLCHVHHTRQQHRPRKVVRASDGRPHGGNAPLKDPLLRWQTKQPRTHRRSIPRPNSPMIAPALPTRTP